MKEKYPGNAVWNIYTVGFSVRPVTRHFPELPLCAITGRSATASTGAFATPCRTNLNREHPLSRLLALQA